jgi:predicted  nucleic acid-binding Zn-ribbon protein
MTDSFTDMTIQEFIDDNDLSTEDVIDQLGIETPDSLTDFYDSEPDVETLADDFTAVEALQDSKESLEEEVGELNDELQSYRTEDFRDTAERLAELVDSREVDAMVEQFEDGELTVDDVEDQIAVAEEAIGSTTTTINDSSKDESESVVDSDPEISTVDRESITSTDSGKLDLSSVRN